MQNNGSIYNVIYTFTKGPWIIQPYFQYTDVPTNPKIGIVKGASTTGGAILVSHAFKHGFSLAGRWEYISSTGSAAQTSCQSDVRSGQRGHIGHGDAHLSIRRLLRSRRHCLGSCEQLSRRVTPSVRTGMNHNQPRAVAEIGFMFGNNIVEKKP